MTLYPKLILDALTHVRYPGTGKDIVSSEMVEDDLRIEGNKVTFSLVFDKSNDPFAKSLVKACEQAILTYVSPEVDIKGNITIKSKQPIAKPTEKPLAGVKYTVAISSGKGGVGKSTVSANLAVALAKLGYKVGLLDADIYGPSMPKMFGLEDEHPTAEVIDGKEWILPIEKYGVKLLSIGFFVDVDKALIWRGAMASNAIKQLINDAQWGDLDYFLIDLPPGTSDIHLTLVQALQLSGAIVVSTPQQVALADARKGLQMFQTEKIEVPILGLVENMAWFTPAELPENRYYIFGKDGCKKLAEEKNVPLLAQIPIVQSICESGDTGEPVALKDNTILSEAFRTLATNMVTNVETITHK
ncbi:MAG TPA: Mrp/NBP35 family ATP-binding protein [Paludibacteraceae bacterium]|nr:Mrp/NBP35 family ATP-binding protein [Paludibacteraceae bacterium]